MSARSNYGQRRVHVTPEVIEAWLVNENRVTTNLPDDARFVRMYARDPTGYYLVFESTEWDEHTEGENIPKTSVTVERANTRVTIQK